MPVVLLHSHGMSGRQWRKLDGELTTRGFTTIVPDLLGQGSSLPWSADPAATEVRARWLHGFVDYWMGRGAWEALRPDARGEFERVAGVVHDGAESLIHDATRADTYRALTMPALLLTGERTPASAQMGMRELASAMPHARFEVIAGAGHMGPLTHADEVTRTIATFVGGAG